MEALRIARWGRQVQGSLLMRASTCGSSQAWRRRRGFSSCGSDGVRLEHEPKEGDTSDERARCVSEIGGAVRHGVRAAAEKEPRGRGWAA